MIIGPSPAIGSSSVKLDPPSDSTSPETGAIVLHRDDLLALEDLAQKRLRLLQYFFLFIGLKLISSLDK
jgi:hypothetical protein